MKCSASQSATFISWWCHHYYESLYKSFCFVRKVDRFQLTANRCVDFWQIIQVISMAFHFEIHFLEFYRFEAFENVHWMRLKKYSFFVSVSGLGTKKIKVFRLGLYVANSEDRLFLQWKPTLFRDIRPSKSTTWK